MSYHPRTILLLALLFLSAVTRGEGQALGRRVYARPELEAAGIDRISALLDWVGGWSSTPDDISWFMSPDGLPSAIPEHRLPEWTTLVDGQPVHLTALGGSYMELLPVPVQQIDSVVVLSSPGFVSGVYANRGVLEIHTARPERGLSARAAARVGNEMGDPGPFDGTPLVTANIERTGWDLVGAAGYGRSGSDVQVSMRSLTQPMTDLRLERFGTHRYRHFNYIRGGSLQVGVPAFGGRHQLLIAQADQEGYTYIPARVRLELSDVIATHAGARGSVALPGGASAEYTLIRSTLGVSKKAEDLPAQTFEPKALLHAGAGVTVPVVGWAATFGIGVRQHPARPAIHSSEAAVERAYSVEAARESATGVSQRYGAAFVGVGGGSAAKGHAAWMWRPSLRRALSAGVGVMEVLPEEAYDFWDREVLETGAVERTIASAEIEWRERFRSPVELVVAGVFSGVGEGDAIDAAPGDAASTQLPLEGDRVGVRIGAFAQPFSGLSSRLEYQSFAVVGGGERFEDVIGSVPRHVLRANVSFQPIPEVRFAAQFRHRSRTRWEGTFLPEPDRESLAPAPRLDLSGETWLSRLRFRIQLRVENVADVVERYHPQGPEGHRRFFVGFGANLP